MSGPRVAVVGGGLAGIAAALECARAGAEVTLLESRARLGGAAYSFTRDGIHADNGQHVFLRCCTGYRSLLEQLEASELVTLQSRLEIAVVAPGARRAWLRRSSLPAPLHLLAALAHYEFLDIGERIAVARAMQALRKVDPDDPIADRRPFGEWLRERGQGANAIGAVWSLIARPTLNLDPENASLAQAAQVFRVGLLEETTAGDIGYARVPLSEIHDCAARRALAAAGVTVRFRSGATVIAAVDGGYRVEISGAPTLEADGVVLAVPPERAAALLPPTAGVDRAALMRLGRSPIVNIHVVYDRQVLDLPFAAGIHTPVQWVFDRTASAGLSRGQYLAISLSAADAELGATVEDLRTRYLAALEELFPAARGASVETFFVTREHSATFRAAPGSRALRPAAGTRLPGLALGGAWTDTGWPATMEGAVRSGRAAAQEVLNTTSRPPLPPVAVNGRATSTREDQFAGGRT